jgi:hypothetical protein
MWHRYFGQNATYVDAANDFPPSLPGLWRRAGEYGQFPVLAAPIIGLVLISLVVLLVTRRRPVRCSVLALAWFAVAVFSIAVPRREFLHYLLLSVMPLGLLSAVAFAALWQVAQTRALRAGLVALALGIGVIAPHIVRARNEEPWVLGSLVDQWRRPAFADGAVLRALRQPGDSLAIWGWSARTYIEARMPQATRDTHTFWATQEEPGRDPHRQIYLADFRAHLPPFFLDATGPGAFFYDQRALHGHENFPALADEIRAHYQPFFDFGYSRLYVRNDRFARLALTPARASALAAHARAVPLPPEVPTLRVQGDAHYEVVEGRNALVLPAPAQAEGPLDAEVRALHLRGSYHPRALAAGSSDGAELVLEFVNDGRVREIFRTPVPFRPGTPLDTRVVLPPFPAGTVLRVRTLPGPARNNAWDWLVLSDLRPERAAFHIPEQFPEFARMPVRVEFSPQQSTGTNLSAQPGMFEFSLTEFDRRFSLTLSRGHDADVTIEHLAHDGATTQLQSRALENANDTRKIAAELPHCVAGDRLRVRLSPTTSPSAPDTVRILSARFE